MTILFYSICVVAILLGIVGIFAPFIPGITLMFFAMLGIAWKSGFVYVSKTTIIILGLLAVVSFVIDYLSGIIGSRYAGASIAGTIGAVVGAILGVIFIGPTGIIIGPALGVLLVESIYKNPKQAVKAASYSVISSLTGIILNIIIAISMIAIFVIALIVA